MISIAGKIYYQL